MGMLDSEDNGSRKRAVKRRASDRGVYCWTARRGSFVGVSEQSAVKKRMQKLFIGRVTRK